MARRRRRPIERGWSTGGMAQFDVTFTSVDNVVTNWEPLFLMEEYLENVEEPFAQNERADYYFERIVVDYQSRVTVAATNDTDLLQYWIALVIMDESLALKNDVPSGATSFAVWSEQWRELNPVVRVLGLHRHKHGIYASPSQDLATDRSHASHRNQEPDMNVFDVRGPLHLRKGEALCLVGSQTGITDNFHSWLSGDAILVDAVYQALVRKKRTA